jgi:probable rRNA maturation factor
MIHLQISENISSLIQPTIIERAAKETLAVATVPGEIDLSILLTDNDQIHKLNLEFLAIDSPTDVLAFPADYVDPDTNTQYLGDVLISYEQANAQAQEAGHSLEDEVELLVVHGILHLLGHDHADPEQKAKMWAAQAEILDRLENSISAP